MAKVPVTPAVVAWAVNESGYTLREIADATGTSPTTVSGWLKGTEKPTLAEARRLAKKLRRPLALLLWSSPPAETGPAVAFRAPTPGEMRDLNVSERRYIRQAHRLQQVASWLRQELEVEPHPLPRFDTSKSPAEAAARARALLAISVEVQMGWSTEFEALRAWRARLEALGVLVFFLTLGDESCRGITLADPRAPVIIINTKWNARARIFTLFHEFGHVLTATTSACASSWAHRDRRSESIERWCEEFAAGVLMPWPDVERFLATEGISGSVTDLAVARALARTFKVSLQAATLRLINGNRATWQLWDQIPRDANVKSKGGGTPEEPRTTPVIRLGEFGRSTAELLFRGMRQDLIDRSQVGSYLRVHDDALSDIEKRLASGSEAPLE